MAVYFPRGRHDIDEIEAKLLNDLEGVAKNNAHGLAFVTNQELTLGERKQLRENCGSMTVELYHLERVAAILDQLKMASIRKQFLGIDNDDEHVISLGGSGGNAPGAGGGGVGSLVAVEVEMAAKEETFAWRAHPERRPVLEVVVQEPSASARSAVKAVVVEKSSRLSST